MEDGVTMAAAALVRGEVHGKDVLVRTVRHRRRSHGPGTGCADGRRGGGWSSFHLPCVPLFLTTHVHGTLCSFSSSFGARNIERPALLQLLLLLHLAVVSLKTTVQLTEAVMVVVTIVVATCVQP